MAVQEIKISPIQIDSVPQYNHIKCLCKTTIFHRFNIMAQKFIVKIVHINNGI